MSKLSTKVEWWLPKPLAEELERHAREANQNLNEHAMMLLRRALHGGIGHVRTVYRGMDLRPGDEFTAHVTVIQDEQGLLAQVDSPAYPPLRPAAPEQQRETHAPEMDERIAARLAEHTSLGAHLDDLHGRVVELESANRAQRQQLDELRAVLADHLRLHPADTNEAVEALDQRLGLVDTMRAETDRRLDELVASLGEDSPEPPWRDLTETIGAVEARLRQAEGRLARVIGGFGQLGRE